jgi:hypothetical protein
MKIQVRSLAIALAIAVPIAVAATANSSAVADQWHVDQGGATSRDDGRALSGAAGLSRL